MKKQHVQLSPEDKQRLEFLMSKGQLQARVYKRAVALLELDRQKTFTAVAETVGLTQQTVSVLATKYKQEGLQCLVDKPRSGRPIEFDGGQRAKITALACSEPPEGHGQWSLRLLAEKVVELEYCPTISHTQVGVILKKTS
ncbi:MAG: helix-turn-helix domain-containing protein [Nitrososphaera sp.]